MPLFFTSCESSSADERAWRRWLAWIVVLAAVLRVAIIFLTPHFAPWGDPLDYQVHAASIAAGHGYPPTQIASPGTPSAFRPPGYPFLLGGLYALAGVHLTAGRLLGAALGVIAIVLLGYLGRAVWGPRIGLIAAGLGAIFLPLIALNASLVSESLFLPVELAFALALMACVRRPGELRWVALAGALCAVAALTRAVADVWLLLVLAVVLLSAVRSRVKLGSCAVAVAAFALVIAPWAIRNATVFHAFVPLSTEDGFTLAGQYNTDAGRDDALEAVWRLPQQVASLQPTLAPLLQRPGGVNEAQLDGALRHAALRYFVHHPGHLVVASWLDAVRMFDLGRAHTFTTGIAYHELGLPSRLRDPTTWSARLLGLLALAAVLLGLLGCRGIRLGPAGVRLGPWWLWAIPILTFLLTVPSVGNPLKRAPLDPFLLLLGALAIGAIAAAAGDRLERRRQAAVIPGAATDRALTLPASEGGARAHNEETFG